MSNSQYPNLQWSHGPLTSLSPQRVFDVFQLRQSVFVLEQACLYPDIDDTDKLAWHLCAYHKQQLALYARVIPAGVTYPQASIGRIVTAPDFRGAQLGQVLVRRAIGLINAELGEQEIKIGAQSALQTFYHHLGFETVSAEYLEDGIPHIDMLRPAGAID